MLIKVKFAPRVLVPKEAIDSLWWSLSGNKSWDFTTSDGKEVTAKLRGAYDTKNGGIEYFGKRVQSIYNMGYERFYNLWRDRFSRINNIWYEFELEEKNGKS